MAYNEIWTTIILGIVQGLTEFLPVSSSGHLVLVPKLFDFKDPGLDVDAFLHLGTLLATLIYFRKEILLMLKSLFIKDLENRKLLLGIILATIPAILIGFGFKSFFGSDAVRSIYSVILTLVLGSLLMYIADKFIAKKLSFKEIKDLNLGQMFFVGLMQVLALFPGVSRSGSTISAGLFMGLNREEAARFSFIVGLPAITGAGLLAVKDLLSEASSMTMDWTVLGIGFVFSFVSGYLAIDFMIKFLKTHSLIGFIVYRVLLALLLITCFI